MNNNIEMWIPRNLNEQDYIKLSNKISVKTNELPIYGVSIFTSMGLYNCIPQLIHPIIKYGLITESMINPIKMCTIAIVMASSYLICKINVLEQPMPEFIGNLLLYIARQIMYFIQNIIEKIRSKN